MSKTTTKTEQTISAAQPASRLPAVDHSRPAQTSRRPDAPKTETRVTGPTLSRLLGVDAAIRKNLLSAPALSLWSYGTNGITLNLPRTPTARLELHKSLPSIPSLWRLEERIQLALSEKATPDHIAAAFAVILGLIPSFKAEERIDYIRCTVEALSLEAGVRRWCPDAISAGLYHAIMKGGFAPNLNELVDAIDAANKTMRSAVDRIPRLAEAISDLEAQLAGDGLLDDESDFPW